MRRTKRRPVGSVFVHGRTWWAKFSLPDKTRVRRNLRVTVDEVDESGARELMIQERAKALLSKPVPGRLDFAALVTLLRTAYANDGRRSWDRVEYALKPLTATFGRVQARDIDETALDSYLAARLRTVSRGTARLELAYLKRMFRLAVAKKLMRPEDAPTFPSVAPGERRRGFFERADFERVREHLPPHLQDMLTFAYLVGARRGEILGLQWSAVSMSAHTVTLERTKNDEDRVLDFAALPELAEVMQRRDEARKALAREIGYVTPWVFWHRRGEPIRDLRHLWKRACDAAGVPGRLLHDCRRSAARNLIRAGVSQVVAQAITGHKSGAVFARYNITDTRDIRAALAALSEAGRSGTVSGTAKR